MADTLTKSYNLNILSLTRNNTTTSPKTTYEEDATAIWIKLWNTTGLNYIGIKAEAVAKFVGNKYLLVINVYFKRKEAKRNDDHIKIRFNKYLNSNLKNLTYNSSASSGSRINQNTFESITNIGTSWTLAYSLGFDIFKANNLTTLSSVKCSGTTTLTYQFSSSVVNSSAQADTVYVKVNYNVTASGIQDVPEYTITFKDAQGTLTGSSSYNVNSNKSYIHVGTPRSKSSTTEPGTDTWTVTFNYNYSGKSNSTASISRSKTRTTNYTPIGWSWSGGNIGTGTTVEVTSDTTFTARYNDSTGAWGNYGPWSDGGQVTCPNPTRTGYKFKGWYTSFSGGSLAANGGSKYSPNSESITLYAQWEIYKLTITYNSNGYNDINGSPLKMPSDTVVNYNETKKLAAYSSASYTKPTLNLLLNYKGNAPLFVNDSFNYSTRVDTKQPVVTKSIQFKEWNTKSDGTGTSYKSEVSFKNTLTTTSDSALTLYAIFNQNSSTYTNNVISIPKISEVNDMVGYKFKGWSTSNSKESIVSDGKLTITKDTILYAWWTPINREYINTYYQDATGSVVKETKTYNITINPFDISTPKNNWGDSYVFLGWTDGQNSNTAPSKWTSQNRGVFSPPSSAPEYFLPVKIIPQDLQNYIDWGDITTLNNITKYVSSSATRKEYRWGCWTASGKYIKHSDTWIKVIEAFVKVNGKWIPVDQMFCKVQDAWRAEVGYKK